MKILGFIFIGFLLGCDPMLAMDNDPKNKDPETIVRTFINAFNSRDAETMVSLMHEDVIWLMIDGDKNVIEADGKVNLLARIKAYFKSTPEFKTQMENIFVEENRVVFRERVTWTTKGKQKQDTSIAIYEVKNGLVRQIHYIY